MTTNKQGMQTKETLQNNAVFEQNHIIFNAAVFP
jgi:hypothetical protein